MTARTDTSSARAEPLREELSSLAGVSEVTLIESAANIGFLIELSNLDQADSTISHIETVGSEVGLLLSGTPAEFAMAGREITEIGTRLTGALIIVVLGVGAASLGRLSALAMLAWTCVVGVLWSIAGLVFVGSSWNEVSHLGPVLVLCFLVPTGFICLRSGPGDTHQFVPRIKALSAAFVICLATFFLVSPLEGFRSAGLASVVGVSSGLLALDARRRFRGEFRDWLPSQPRSGLLVVGALGLIALLFFSGRGLQSFEVEIDKLRLIGEHTSVARNTATIHDALGFSEVAHFVSLDNGRAEFSYRLVHVPRQGDRREFLEPRRTEDLGVPSGAFPIYTRLVDEVVSSSRLVALGAIVVTLAFVPLLLWGKTASGADRVVPGVSIFLPLAAGIGACVGALSLLGGRIDVGSMWAVFLTAVYAGFGASALAVARDTSTTRCCVQGLTESGLVLGFGFLAFAASPWRTVAEAGLVTAAGVAGTSVSFLLIAETCLGTRGSNLKRARSFTIVILLIAAFIAGFKTATVDPQVVWEKLTGLGAVLVATGLWQVLVALRTPRSQHSPVLVGIGGLTICGAVLPGYFVAIGVAFLAVVSLRRYAPTARGGASWVLMACVAITYTAEASNGESSGLITSLAVSLGALAFMAGQVEELIHGKPVFLRGQVIVSTLLALAPLVVCAAVPRMDSETAFLAAAAPGLGLGFSTLTSAWRRGGEGFELAVGVAGAFLAALASSALLIESSPATEPLLSALAPFLAVFGGLAIWLLLRPGFPTVSDQVSNARERYLESTAALVEDRDLALAAEQICGDLIGYPVCVDVSQWKATLSTSAVAAAVEANVGNLQARLTVEAQKELSALQRRLCKCVLAECLRRIQASRACEEAVRSQSDTAIHALTERHDLRKALLVAAAYLESDEQTPDRVLRAREAVEESLRLVDYDGNLPFFEMHELPLSVFVARLNRLMGERIRRETVTRIKCDPDHTLLPELLVWAVLNLVDNAHAAYPSHAVVLEFENNTRGLVIRVKDDGRGIASRVITKIGRVLFSTRKSSGGTGIGLSGTHSKVARCGGVLTVNSVEGQGTTAEIVLQA